MTTNRASLYVRLSKAAGAENLSLDGMISDLRALCSREGFEEIALHVDDGKSGGFRDRPEFLAWIADAREGRADILAAYHVDRMTREGVNVAAILLDVVEGKDPATGRVIRPPVRLLDPQGLDSDDGDSFRWRFVIAAEVARAERERIRARTKASHERARQAGRYHGGMVPFGYKVIPNPAGPGKVLDVDPIEAAAVRDMAKRAMAGEPLYRIALDLTANGPKPHRAASWSPQAVRQVLTGDAIAGRLIRKGEVVRDENGHALTPYPPVLAFAEVVALRERLRPTPRAEAPASRHASHVLSGLLTCHSCGRALTVGYARYSNGSKREVYRCSAKANGQTCEKPVAVSLRPIEAYVVGLYLDAVGSQKAMERRVVHHLDDDLAAVEDSIAATASSLAKTPTAELFQRLQELHAQREEIEGRTPAGPRVEDVWTGRTVREEYEARDTDGRRELLRRFFLSLVVKPGSPGAKRGRHARHFDEERLDVVTVLDVDVEAREFPWWDLEDDLDVRRPAARWTPDDGPEAPLAS